MRGWHFESYRHYLAAKGYMTVKRKPGLIGRVGDVRIYAKPLEKGHVYPIAPEDIKKFLQNQDEQKLKGLKAVEFTRPKDKDQKEAWGQLVRSKRKILIFSQPSKDGKIDGVPPARIREVIRGYVLPHEVGHNIALNQRRITDKDLRMAEARADANVLGMDVQDRDVRLLKR